MANNRPKPTEKRLVGISYPFRKEAGEFPKRVYDTECVQSDLITLFQTPIRSRVMRPLAGSDAERLVFESIGPLLSARMQRSIRQTIFTNEPRVLVRAINIEDNETTVTSTIVYVVQGVQDVVQVEVSKEGVV